MQPFTFNLRPKIRLAFGTVDATDSHLVDRQLACRFCQERLHDGDSLHSAGRTLRSAGGSIGHYRNSPPVHGRRLIEQGDNATCGASIAYRVVGTRVADHEHVKSRNAAFFRESNLHSPQDAWPSAPDEVLFLAADAH